MSRHVNVAINAGDAYGAQVLAGIRDWRRRHGPWRLAITAFSALDTGMGADGYIIQTGHNCLDAARKLRAPVVNVGDGSAAAVRSLPSVLSDHQAIGRLAGEHLLRRGFRHFAFLGPANRWYSEQRLLGLQAHVEPTGAAVSVQWVRSGRKTREEHIAQFRCLRQWLVDLPKPVGLLACHDHLSRQVVDSLRPPELHVPTDIAVVGVDNDENTCTGDDPTLSSVAVDATRIGYEAAVLLMRLMNGEASPRQSLTIPPVEVVGRHSTDTWVFDDALINAALRRIRSQRTTSLRVAGLARHLNVSRRSLEMRFMKTVGRSPAEVIRDQRHRHVRHLLQATDMPVSHIAVACGYPGARHLVEAFRRQEGISPMQYREVLHLANPEAP